MASMVTGVKHNTILLIIVIIAMLEEVPVVEAAAVLQGTERAIHYFALIDGVCGIGSGEERWGAA